MKKTVSLLLICVLSFALFSCGSGTSYPAVPSTEQEATVLLRFRGEHGTYDLRYELYRALYLSAIEETAGDEARADLLVRERAAEIFAISDLCAGIGYSLDSADVKDTVDRYIAASVEGGVIDGNPVAGYDSYDDYLAALKSMNLTYEVQCLLFRYMIGIDALEQYYAGTLLTGGDVADAVFGKLEITEETVRAFYESDDCVRVIRAFFPKEIYSATRVTEMRGEIAAKTTEQDVIRYIVGHTTAGGSDIENGLTVGTHSLDARYYKELTEEAFSLLPGETSRVIYVSTGEEEGSFVLYGTRKSEDHFNRCYNEICAVYAEQEIGKIIANRVEKLLSETSDTAAYRALDRAAIGKEDA